VARAPRENPVRARINALFFHAMDWYMHWTYAPLKTRLFNDLPPVLVELGTGAGANFRYFRPGTTVIAVEPNRHMHAPMARRARRWNIALDVRGHGADTLELDDNSVDAVVASLVLCTVADPDAVVREVQRVLRPGGRFVCIEHVAAPAHTLLGRLQRWVHRPWQWFFEGCHTHRDTAGVLARGGFSSVRVQPFVWRSAFVPVRPQIAAICTK
jgi:ubiquinone/menaquinone biosynthesis C-methylase UbiE